MSVDSMDMGVEINSRIDSEIDWASRPDLDDTVVDDAVVSAYLWIASRGHISRDDIGPLAQRLVRRWRSDLNRPPSPAADPLIETLDSPYAVWACIEDALASAESEVLVSRPAGESEGSASAFASASAFGAASALPLPLTPPGESALLGRGVVLRLVYQHTARFHRPTQMRAAAAIAAGAQIRTLPSPPPPMIVIDRSSAFLPHSERADAAVLIRESSTVAHLCASFDQAWSLGSAFRTGPVGARQATDDLKSSIIRMLAGGLKDDAIAKRLGLSVRSLRGHIAEIMSRLGADSRFQAGVHAAQADWLTEDRLPRDVALI